MTNSFLFFLIGIPLVYEFQSFAGVSLLVIILAPITIVILSRDYTVYGGCAILRFADPYSTSIAKYSNFGRIERRDCRRLWYYHFQGITNLRTCSLPQ